MPWPACMAISISSSTSNHQPFRIIFLNNLNKLCLHKIKQLIDEEIGNLWTRCNIIYLQPANKQFIFIHKVFVLIYYVKRVLCFFSNEIHRKYLKNWKPHHPQLKQNCTNQGHNFSSQAQKRYKPKSKLYKPRSKQEQIKIVQKTKHLEILTKT